MAWNQTITTFMNSDQITVSLQISSVVQQKWRRQVRDLSLCKKLKSLFCQRPQYPSAEAAPASTPSLLPNVVMFSEED